jgi:histidine triad (HIT) family protein
VDCPFCDLTEDDVIAQSGPYLAIWTHEPPAGSVMVIPKAHRRAPWDLTRDGWMATQDLLSALTRSLSDSHQPDGWNVGWNVGRVGGQTVEHAHCHLVPRYLGERYAGRGIRWWLKQQQNHANALIPSALIASRSLADPVTRPATQSPATPSPYGKVFGACPRHARSISRWL